MPSDDRRRSHRTSHARPRSPSDSDATLVPERDHRSHRRTSQYNTTTAGINIRVTVTPEAAPHRSTSTRDRPTTVPTDDIAKITERITDAESELRRAHRHLERARDSDERHDAKLRIEKADRNLNRLKRDLKELSDVKAAKGFEKKEKEHRREVDRAAESEEAERRERFRVRDDDSALGLRGTDTSRRAGIPLNNHQQQRARPQSYAGPGGPQGYAPPPFGGMPPPPRPAGPAGGHHYPTSPTGNFFPPGGFPPQGGFPPYGVPPAGGPGFPPAGGPGFPPYGAPPPAGGFPPQGGFPPYGAVPPAGASPAGAPPAGGPGFPPQNSYMPPPPMYSTGTPTPNGGPARDAYPRPYAPSTGSSFDIDDMATMVSEMTVDRGRRRRRD